MLRSPRNSRYGSNIPQAFDGGRLMVDHGPIHAELITAKPVAVGQGHVDDRKSDTKRLGGIHMTTRIARFSQGIARENRDTYGLRIFGEAKWLGVELGSHASAWPVRRRANPRLVTRDGNQLSPRGHTVEATPAIARQSRQR